MALTKEQREALPDEHFAVPGKRKLPIPDETHTRLAWDMVDRTQGLTDDERTEARTRIKKRAKELGIDVSGWETSLHHAADDVTLTVLSAMSLDMPLVEDHPNRMPFKGVLTFVDQPSDMPPGGSGGRRTYLPRLVAESMLSSLMAMPVDFTPDFDGHDVKRKIGTITAAEIVGDELQIEGFFFAADFPQECARIKREKEALGFSYEIKAQTLPEGSLLKIVGGVFTGAAVLKKDKAAYQSTSLAAAAAGDFAMTKEELQAMLDGALGPIVKTVGDLTKGLDELKASTSTTALLANKDTRDKVAPHATALRNCAAAMEAAGIGLDSRYGHVKVLHHMAAHMEAEAATGKLPHIYRDHDWTFASADTTGNQPAKVDLANDPAIKALTDGLASVTTLVTDLKASAFQQAQPPARRTVSAEITALLAKGGINEVPKEGMTEQQVDTMLKAAGITDVKKRIEAKLSISQAGLLIKQ